VNVEVNMSESLFVAVFVYFVQFLYWF